MKPINTSLPITGFWDSRQGGRTENQDQCAVIDTPLGFLALVCDGMGGGPSGCLASDTAVRKIYEFLNTPHEDMNRKDILKEAIEYAHNAIVSLGDENPSLKGMGTTVAAVLINDYSAIVAHVGDSRVYQFRHGYKIFRTADHSMVAEMVRNGALTEEQARLSSQSNIITKALGGQLKNLAEVTERAYEAGDRFLLCSDGIWGMVPEKELIRRTAKPSILSKAVDNTVDSIDALGRDSGNTHDNMTIVMLEMKKDSKLKEKMSKKTIRIIAVTAVLCLLSIVANVILSRKLMVPNEAEKKVETLSEEISAKDKRIEELMSEVSKLNTEVAKSKRETADAKLEAAAEQKKAAERAQTEAEQKAKEAAEAAEKAKEAAQQAQKSANDLAERLKGVVTCLQQAKNKQEGAERIKLRNNIINELKTLSVKDSKHKNVYDKVIGQLNSQKSKQAPSKSGSHYDTLISEIKKLIK